MDPFGFGSLATIPGPTIPLDASGGAFQANIGAARSNVVDDPTKLVAGILGNVKQAQDISYVPKREERKDKELQMQQERHDLNMTLDEALMPYKVAGAREGVRSQQLSNRYAEGSMDARLGMLGEEWKRIQRTGQIEDAAQTYRVKQAAVLGQAGVAIAQTELDKAQGTALLGQYMQEVNGTTPDKQLAASRAFIKLALDSGAPTGAVLPLQQHHMGLERDLEVRNSIAEQHNRTEQLEKYDVLAATNFNGEEMNEYKSLQNPMPPLAPMPRDQAFARVYQKARERQLDASSDRKIEEITNHHNPNSGVQTQRSMQVRQLASQLSRAEADFEAMKQNPAKIGDMPGQKARVDYLRTQLERATKALNSGVDPLPTGGPGYGSPLMPGAADPRRNLSTTLPTPLAELQERSGLDPETFNRALAIRNDKRLTQDEKIAALRALGLQ